MNRKPNKRKVRIYVVSNPSTGKSDLITEWAKSNNIKIINHKLRRGHGPNYKGIPMPIKTRFDTGAEFDLIHGRWPSPMSEYKGMPVVLEYYKLPKGGEKNGQRTKGNSSKNR